MKRVKFCSVCGNEWNHYIAQEPSKIFLPKKMFGALVRKNCQFFLLQFFLFFDTVLRVLRPQPSLKRPWSSWIDLTPKLIISCTHEFSLQEQYFSDVVFAGFRQAFFSTPDCNPSPGLNVRIHRNFIPYFFQYVSHFHLQACTIRNHHKTNLGFQFHESQTT